MQQINTSSFTSRCKQRSRPSYTRTYWSRPLLVAQYSIARSPLGSNDREHTAPFLLENQNAIARVPLPLNGCKLSHTPCIQGIARCKPATVRQELVQSSLDTARHKSHWHWSLSADTNLILHHATDHNQRQSHNTSHDQCQSHSTLITISTNMNCLVSRSGDQY